MRDNTHVITWKRLASATFVGIAIVTRVRAGGSGLNVAVVVNQNSTNSVELGNYYCEQRAVPPQNLIRINWTGGNEVWTRTEFENTLRTPLTTALASRQLTNQIDYVLLCMDIPYRITNTTVNVANNVNATTAALFYGFKDNPADPTLYCTLADATTNLYAGTEGIFRSTPPISATSNSWLVMMLTSSNLAQAKAVVDRGLAGDHSMPTEKVFFAKSDDVNRNVRYLLFDNALFNIQLGGVVNAVRTNVNTTFGLGTMFGYANGYQVFTVYGSFAPGAMADSLTSYGGNLFGNPEHTRVLDFINAGATASYGTVIEPCNYLAKFPTTMNYFYQARGFTIAESYYQSLTNPYQGILVGEPLSAPFARPATGTWSNLPEFALLAGTTNLSLQFTAADDRRPVQQVDLFVDGLFAQTITNIPPRTNNILYVTINGFTTNFTVPANTTIKLVASNLTAKLNANSYASQTKVAASAIGDRIQLQYTNLALPGASIPVSTSNYVGTASVLATFVSPVRTNFLDTTAFGFRNFFVTNMPGNGTWLQIAVTRTNGLATTISVTNSAGNTNTAVLLQSLMDAINTNSVLTSVDGVIAEDLIPYYFVNQSGQLFTPAATFNLRVRGPGWAEARIQAMLTDSGPLTIIPSGTQRLDENINDLHPRNYLYLTAGLTNLNLTFPFNTTTNADGYHELTAVAYEGSHVRTQKRISQNVRIQNDSWSVAFTTLLGGPNTALEATLQFAVVANTNNITKIELFSTGGLLGTANNVTNTTFAISAGYLGLGLHPFYALVSRSDGKQYRTDTKWIRIVGSESPFNVSVLGSAPTLSWPASAGRPYQVLSATDVTHTFTLRDAVTPTNSTGQWSETNNTTPQRYYRVKTP